VCAAAAPAGYPESNPRNITAAPPALQPKSFSAAPHVKREKARAAPKAESTFAATIKIKTPGTMRTAQSESASKAASAASAGCASEKSTHEAHKSERKNFRTLSFFVIIHTTILIKIDMPAARAISVTGA
jgi:hypothetical protein